MHTQHALPLVIDLRAVTCPRTFSCSSTMSLSISRAEALSQFVITDTTTDSTSGVIRIGTRVTASTPAKTLRSTPTATVIGCLTAASIIFRPTR